MSHYRKIDVRIWNDAKFNGLSDRGKLCFFFLLTHPHMTALGAMRATITGMAEELGWETEAFREAFMEGYRKGLVKHDAKACFVWLPNFLKYNGPESPNVVKSWAKAADMLPECALKYELFQHVKDYLEGLSEAFAKALPKDFHEDFAKAMPNQEQEQEQEQELHTHVQIADDAQPIAQPDEHDAAQTDAPPKRSKPKRTAEHFERFWSQYPVKKGKRRALQTWKSKQLDSRADELMADVQKRIKFDRQWRRGFIPHGSTYLNQEVWNDAIEQEAQADQHKQGNGAAAGPSATRYPPLNDEAAWIKLGQQNGIIPKTGESWDSFRARVKTRLEAGR